MSVAQCVKKKKKVVPLDSSEEAVVDMDLVCRGCWFRPDLFVSTSGVPTVATDGQTSSHMSPGIHNFGILVIFPKYIYRTLD